MKMTNDDFNAITMRVVKLTDNIMQVDKEEAFTTCAAYTRVLGFLMAGIASSDDEFKSDLMQLFTAMLNEGLAFRRDAKNANK